jgi:hypothetical protein
LLEIAPGVSPESSAPGIGELRVSDGYRIAFEKLEDGFPLRRVGPHDVLRHP